MIRILIAALLGAVAMFVWTAIAHMATPLGQIGFGQIPDEAPVISAMQQSIGDKDGFYFFPWFDVKDQRAMEKAAEAEKTSPHGLLLYHPAGQHLDANMGPMLTVEFIKQFAQALLAAWIVSMIAGGFALRLGVVAAMFGSSAIAVNVSYWNWYGFPLDYTVAQIAIELVSGVVAGAAIAWQLGRKKAG